MHTEQTIMETGLIQPHGVTPPKGNILHSHWHNSPKSNIRLHSTIQYISTKHLPSLHDCQSMRTSFPYTDSHNKTAETHILVLLAIVGKNEIFELNFNFDPFFICQCRPDVMWLRDGCLIRLQYHLGTLCVDMEGSQNQDQTWEGLNYKESNI